MADFVHLHLHTEYSLLDGAVRLSKQVYSREVGDSGEMEDKIKTVSPLCDALKARGMDAVAITDHGNMYGVHMFVEAMRGAGIKPIIGSEFYVAADMYDTSSEVLHRNDHLILLAKNETGYKNLMYLSSKSFMDGFYGRPRIDLKLMQGHTDGLICCSACLAGHIPRLLVHNDYKGAVDYALILKDMFGAEDFYIEIQDHGIPEEKKILPMLVRLAKEIGVKVVATNDVHYIEKEDADMQDTMECITLNERKDAEPRNRARFDTQEFYLKTEDEMRELFSWCPEALESTREIANKVEDYFVSDTHNHFFIPKYTNEEMGDRDTATYIKDLAWEGLQKKYPVVTDEIKQRLEYELEVINKCGFNDYFLIVWDYCNAAKKMGIPVGPGRGSGVGSLVAYSIGITDVDPLRYSLLFERFLSEERVSMPDFDVDFCFVRRPEVMQYVEKKYGAENVSKIVAYSTMSAKAVVKDVARAYGIEYNETNNWVKNIPVGHCLLKQVLTEGSDAYSADFKKLYDENATAKEIIDVAMQLEGMPRQTSEHAAGVVICSEPLLDHVPMSRNKDDIVTQFDKLVVEHIGLLKMDFLGLKTLTDIDEAIKYIKEDKGVDVDFHKIGYDDPKVYELMSSGDCVAVFQLESGGMTKFMTQLQPSNIEDVIAGISMYRPGPMQFIDDFLKGKRNPDSVVYAHPLLKELLEVTYGCIVYQEQVMQIAQKIAGYSFGGADIMRRAISKKKLSVLKEQKEVFLHGGYLKGDKTNRYVPGAVANGVSEDIAGNLFEQMLKFASYAFNKSHATAYTFLTYQTGWLKCYYPTHFLVAIINNRIDNADELTHYINYMKRKGIKILAPDINLSREYFSIDHDNVRYGLMGIKNVGKEAMKFVLNERNVNGPFKDIKDFLERTSGQVNKRMVESLIKSGAFDFTGKTRSTLMASYESIMNVVANDKKNGINGQMSLFDDLIEDVEIQYTELEEYPHQQILADEKNMLGMYVSGHPLDEYPENKGEFNFDTSMIYVENEDIDEDIDESEEGNGNVVVDKNLANKQVKFGCIVASSEKKATKSGQRFAVGMLEDRMGTIQFAMYARAYEQYRDLLEKGVPIKVYGKVDLRDENEPKISVDKIEEWENPKKAQNGKKSGGVIYVLVHDQAEQKLISKLLQLHPGNTPVQAQIIRNGKPCLVEFPSKVEPSDELLKKLGAILGSSNNVKYKQGDSTNVKHD